MGDTLYNASGAAISGMGRDDVGVIPPFPVDGDRMINTDILTNYNNVYTYVSSVYTYVSIVYIC